MKRKELEKKLRKAGCYLIRHLKSYFFTLSFSFCPPSPPNLGGDLFKVPQVWGI